MNLNQSWRVSQKILIMIAECGIVFILCDNNYDVYSCHFNLLSLSKIHAILNMSLMKRKGIYEEN